MKLSIITINYNNKAGLLKTIDSVMSQTWRDFEWIIIDGGSMDGSKEVIESNVSNPKSKISYWCSEPDKGIYNAINKGLSHAIGDYISCMNSGDVFHASNTLKEIFSKEHTADIIYGDNIELNPGQLPVRCGFRYPVDIYWLYRANICHQAMFTKRHLLRNGYDENFKIAADYAMLLQVAMNGGTFEHVNVVVCDYDHDGISAHNDELLGTEKRTIQDMFIPSAVMELICIMHAYEKNPYIKQSIEIVKNGGFTASVLKSCIRTLTILNSFKKMFHK